MAEHAVGSRISLISKSEIRYEGFLHFINAKENTVGLKNVRMFGTEGRRHGQNEVAANSQLYEYIVFRGADIKDLTVFDDGLSDPAVISATPAKQSDNAWQQGRDHRGRGGNQATSGAGAPRGRGGYQQQTQQHHQSQQHGRGGAVGHHNAPAGGARGRGAAFQDRRPVPAAQPAAQPRQRHEHTGREFTPASGTQKEFKEDFDFAKAQTDFHNVEGRDSVKKAYDKTSSFFDNLSSDVTDRQQQRGPQRQALRDQQKKVDGETFGNEFVGAHQSSRYRRGGGGRGRGRFNARN